MMNAGWSIIKVSAMCAILLSACGLVPGGDELPADQLASTMVAETAAAAAPVPSPTLASTSPPPTEEPPTDLPTATQRPAPTNTPGPLALQDDFSADSGYWDCDQCTFENGQLHYGPYPVSGAFVQHMAVCAACGMVTNYRMSADVQFGDGPSERGFGFLARGTEEYILTFEITPWQDFDFWKFEYATGEWTWVNGIFAGAVRPGNQVNRIEIEVATNASGSVDVSLRVNGKTPLVIFNQPAEPGAVGFTLYGHAVDLFFDNFEFATEDSPIFPENFDFLSA